ncbi:hypothetical protein GCM10008903_10190 [Clostridium cadaveris]
MKGIIAEAYNKCFNIVQLGLRKICVILSQSQFVESYHRMILYVFLEITNVFYILSICKAMGENSWFFLLK